MSLPDSLCIDLGASFTKVAYRPQPDATSHLLTDGELLDAHHFCIPSVAARNRANDAWVFGPDAADLRASERVEVHQNWKADLFAPGALDEGDLELLDGAVDEADALLLAHVPALRAFEVARRFLGWLYDEQIPRMLGHGRYRDAEVQLCVPNFVLESVLAPRLDRTMRDIGFRNDGAYTLSEPRANLIGILTEGRNPQTAGGRPNLGAMFGDAKVLRTLARPDQAVLLLDVGAYTTDIALAGFAHQSGDGFDDNPAMSVRMGVRLLDDWILEGASEEERERVAASALEREHFRSTVHGAITAPRPEEYGLTQAAVDAAVVRFAEAVLQSVDAFLAQADDMTLFSAVLTGGGANIAGISSRLAAGLLARGVGTLHAPTATDVPTDLRKLALGPELVRGASAVGGCSTLYRL